MGGACKRLEEIFARKLEQKKIAVFWVVCSLVEVY
jgi:hypothetical protein